MKSLEKERSRRYETANGLARDVERYLADEAVEACPPSLRYRLGKALRKHRGPALAATLLFVALSAGIVGTSLGLVRANAERTRARRAEAVALKNAQDAKNAAAAEAQQRKRADVEAAAAKAVRDFLQDDLLRQASFIHQVEVNSVYQDGNRLMINPTINELLDRAAAQLTTDKIEAKFPNLPFVQAEVLKAVGDAYASVTPAKAIEPIKRAIVLYRQARGADDPATLAARHSLGMALLQNRQNDEAVKELAAVYADRTRILGQYHPATFATRDLLGGRLSLVEEPADDPVF
jgi:eukaryotic-like serine/threonine-protein kinase